MNAAQSHDGSAAVDHHLYAAFVAAVPKILNGAPSDWWTVGKRCKL